ncbi:MAG TPA: hypothetical protein VFE62_25935, partial [Gemmataceae bacterium]|nr:hypothetical protein [Gemmataceae bacterium]
MRSWIAMMLVGSLGIAALSAQQPAGKGPMLPPINPATAKADIVITGLDGPGLAIVAGGGDSELIAAGCENGTIQVFKKDTIAAFKSGKGTPAIWKGHQGPVRALAWNGGPVLASAGADKKINFWKVAEGKVVGGGPLDFRIRTIAMSPDGKTLASGGEGEVIQLWDVASGKPTAKLADKMDWTLCLAFSADSKQLLSGDYQGKIRIWDVAGAKKTATLEHKAKADPKGPPPDPIPVTAITFAPDGKSIVIGADDGPIHFLNLPDGKLLR